MSDCICSALFTNPVCPRHGVDFLASRARDCLSEVQELIEKRRAPLCRNCKHYSIASNNTCIVCGYNQESNRYE
jgi:hypothetical protein